MISEELSLTSYRFSTLSGRIWHPDTPPETVVVMVHGMGEHSGVYQDWAARFCSRGLLLACFDLRGHGLSSGKRGHLPTFEAMYDLDVVVRYLRDTCPGVPVVLYGHSFGGNLALYYAMQPHDCPVDGLIASSPTLVTAPPAHKTLAGLAGLLVRIVPRATLRIGIKASDLTRREAEAEASGTQPDAPSDLPEKHHSTDPLLHQYISIRTYCDMQQRAGAILQASGADFAMPVLLMQGVDDPLALPIGAVQLASHLGRQAQLKLWKHARHELHREDNRDEVFEFVMQWLHTNVPGHVS